MRMVMKGADEIDVESHRSNREPESSEYQSHKARMNASLNSSLEPSENHLCRRPNNHERRIFNATQGHLRAKWNRTPGRSHPVSMLRLMQRGLPRSGQGLIEHRNRRSRWEETPRRLRMAGDASDNRMRAVPQGRSFVSSRHLRGFCGSRAGARIGCVKGPRQAGQGEKLATMMAMMTASDAG